ncbi:MAG: phosphoribosyltransferase family protein [Schlesneria sp.]
MIRFSDSMKYCRIKNNPFLSPFFSAAINFVYAPTCLFCEQEVNPVGSRFCESCLSKLKPVHSLECGRCGAPVGPYTDLTRGCGQCHRESYAFDGVIRLGVYDGQMRLASLRAKASGGESLARGLADVLVEQKRAKFDERAFDLVVPVPEHWTRRFLHPHYAAETISRQIARRLHVPWNREILLKSRRTPKQATSPTPLRRQQQQGSFAVSRTRQISGKTILLVDDILTTGSTADAAARTLKNAGASYVIVAVIAVSPLRK